MRDGLNISSLPSPQDRYKLEKKLGAGIFGEVYRALDSQAAGKAVAIKIQINTEENETHIQDEYKILRDFTQHPNIVDFYGVFCERIDYEKRIWFVLELCEYGSVIDMVRKLKAMDRKMSEEHIAYILKYTIKAVVYLHDNSILHRNIRCSNILISKEGEVKLTDFSLSCKLNGPDDRAKLSIGSPSWMAPEMITIGEEGYGNRSDVWAIGISTIEMVDGKGPFEDMHPTGAIFQIQRNPPPSVLKPSMSSNDLNDFVSECLSKNPEYRPFMMELEEHPFIQTVPENDFHLSTELKMLAAELMNKEAPPRAPEKIIKNGLLTTQGGKEHETMQVEDLAALEHLTEDSILFELQVKFQKGAFTSFIGDVLLILNPNADVDIYHDEYHRKYECKSRSDNEPHIFAVADAAYQDALHHNEPQHIVFSGECKAGKTTSMNHALSHLSYLGSMKNNTGERIQKAARVIQDCITAATPINSDSTRGIFQIQVTYGTSGKLSGALFWLYQLEKWRVSSTDMTHANFNILYYFYDGLEAEGRLNEFHLESNRKHRYLRILEEPGKINKGVRETPIPNVRSYKEFRENLKFLDWDEEEIKFFEKVLASILILGNVRFRDGKNGSAEIENLDDAKKVSKLLELEEVKFLWALLNYCLIEKGNAVKRRHSTDEARDARDTLASALYKRLIDWMVNLINSKLAFMRAVFGDKYSVSLLDMFGFECYHRNRLEQLIVNTTNEQIQFLYNQRMFAWEMQEEAEEGVRAAALHFYDNKKSVDQLMKKPLGVFYILDDASRVGEGAEYIMNTMKTKCKGPYVKPCGTHEFSVAHYTGKVNYDVREMADKNKDFLPPEMIETMRSSSNLILQELFRNKFTKAGNLTASTDASPAQPGRSKSEKELDNLKARKHNVESKGQYSQIRRMRTASAVYRATSLEILKQLSIGPGSGGTFYVRCIRTDLNDSPRGFQTEVVKQQLRALAVLDTAKARQFGFSCRVPFAEFIRRYRFLAFDFDETVEETADNCRLLLIRLKMEGWELGKTKVFLKYYNEEFLSRLYETQVKKIIKVQSMMRLFLAKRKATKDKSKAMHLKGLKKQQSQQRPDCSEEEAALRIQKAYRGFVVRKAYGPLVNKSTGQIDETTAKFLKSFARKWKSRSMFQVLLQYRAVRYQDLVNFSQQVHIYNQGVVDSILNTSVPISLDRVDPQANQSTFLGNAPQSVWKLPFRIDQIQYYDTSHMCDPNMKKSDTLASPSDYDNEPQWDEPLRRRCTSAQTDPFATSTSTQTIITIPFCRDPSLTIPTLPPDDEEIDPGPPTDLPEESEVDLDSGPQDPPQDPDSATDLPDETKIDPEPVATETPADLETEPESVSVDPPAEPDPEPVPADLPAEPEPEPVPDAPPPEPEDPESTPDPDPEPTPDPDPEAAPPSDDPENDPQDTYASPTDSDNEPWDEPLRRRCNAAQTDPFKASISTQTLITIPFCRDPTLPVPTLPPDEPEIYPRSKSPNKIMYPRSSGRSPSPQAYYQPPAPWHEDTNVLENTSPPLRRPTRVHYNIDASDLPDPISELHALAKLSHTNENEDDPPFNFQAMLKRTPRNRASMKRHGEIRESGEESRSSGESRSVYYGGNGNSTRNQETRFGGREDYDDFGDNSRRNFPGRDNRDVRETIEIAPGITLEGEVADL